MGYKIYKKEKDIFFKYILNKKHLKKKEKQINNMDNPFGILSRLNLK